MIPNNCYCYFGKTMQGIAQTFFNFYRNAVSDANNSSENQLLRIDNNEVIQSNQDYIHCFLIVIFLIIIIYFSANYLPPNHDNLKIKNNYRNRKN